jgi:1-acyl-sn-glycerol-3-phosphate acyltransferase
MHEGWRGRLDGVLALLTRLTLRVFFREIEVVGLARVPRGVPLVVVANHVNALVDALLILAFLGLRPRILAKSTLWRHPVMAPLLLLAGGVPVYRRQDGKGMTRNFDTFRRCRAVLAEAGRCCSSRRGPATASRIAFRSRRARPASRSRPRPATDLST